MRDNIHSRDVCDAFYAFYESPRCAAVYNLGGGRSNSISILEAISRMGDSLGKTLGFQSDYPNWGIRVSVEEILHQFVSLRSTAQCERVLVFGLCRAPCTPSLHPAVPSQPRE